MNRLSQRTGRVGSKAWLSVIFSTAVLAAVMYFADIETVLNTLKDGNLSLILLALFTSNVPILVYALTWKEVFKISGIEINYLNSLRVVLANAFINNITPFGNIGGEAAATYLISKVTDYNSGKILSSILMASLINFAPLGSILALGLIFTGESAVLLILGIFLSLALISRKYWLNKNILPRSIYEKTPEKILNFSRDFIQASKILIDHKPKLLVLLGVTHFAILFDILSIIIVAKAFGGDLVSPLILLVIPVARVANYFPTPGGSGSYEAMMIGLLTLYMNLTPAVAVSTVVTYRALTYYVGLILGYIALNSIGMDEDFLSEHGKNTKQ